MSCNTCEVYMCMCVGVLCCVCESATHDQAVSTLQGSLRSLLRKDGVMDEVLTGKITGQILEGLAYLHGQNIIHRDIKGVFE